MIWKLAIVILCVTWIAHTEQEEDDCYDPPITLNYVQSTKESIFLRWQSNNICSYTYNVTYYEEGHEDDMKQVTLEQDNTVLNVTDLIPNTEYVFLLSTDYSSEAKNFTIYTAPGEVRHLSATNATANSVVLTWEPPLNGSGSGIQSEVCAIPIDDSKRCILVNDNKYKFTGLASCTNYTFSVTSVGHESYLSSSKLNSSAVIVHQQTSKSVPGKVTNIKVEGYRIFGVHIDWSPPEVSPNCVTHYRVYIHTQNYNKSFTVDGMETFLYVPDSLDACTEVNVSVTSVGDEGPSKDTATLTVKTAPALVSDLHYTTNGPSWVNLAWLPAMRGVDCLSNYEVYAELSDGLSDSRIHVTTITAGSNYIQYNYTGFGPCESRHIYIYTVNEYGIYSNYSHGIEVHSREYVFGLSLDIQVYVNKSRPYYTQVTWEPANIPSECLSLYEVVADSFHSLVDESSARIQGTSYTFYNLKTCTNYTFFVNVIGPQENYQLDSAHQMIPYYGVNVLQDISVVEYPSKKTELDFTFVSDIGTDCVQYYHVCWYLKDDNNNSTCVSYPSSYNYVVIPEGLQSISEIHVNAVFYDGVLSNEVIYYNSGMSILQSPSFIFICLILNLILRKKQSYFLKKDSKNMRKEIKS